MKERLAKVSKMKKDERGLTLVELLAVVVILAIVAAIGFILIGNVIENSRKDAHISNALQVISAVKLAEVSENLEFPVEALTDIDTLGSMVDPWDKNAYTTAEVTKSESGVYSIKLLPDKGCEINGKSEEALQKGREEICP